MSINETIHNVIKIRKSEYNQNSIQSKEKMKRPIIK